VPLKEAGFARMPRTATPEGGEQSSQVAGLRPARLTHGIL
jgi:hypothetical protein